MPLLTYEEFVETVERRADADENRIVQEFLTRRVGTHRFRESGHFRQAYWGATLFFLDNPHAKDIIRNLPVDEPVEIHENEELLEDWLYFLQSNEGDRSDVLKFDISILHRGLPPSLGGTLSGGGGAGFPLKIVLRLVADI